ncbi:DoxX family protein [Mycobacterium hubeiense]|uniref:DoxX family protein n=1 Tax=Mycobacterium hubeiense TaxID=1867256 RepID=UPI000C7EB0F5|nr:DoxX family protein [Mycobacterium sp. QGD 101]
MTSKLESRLSTYASPVLSIFRIVFGFLFTLHGASKVFGWPLGTALEVGSWPTWWAGLIELVAGLLIMIGLFSRIAAFIASGEMAVAYFWQHQPNAFWPLDPQLGGNGGELAILYCFAFLLIAAMGPGPWAINQR